MRRSLRMVPVVLMGSLAIAYILARPTLATRVPYLAIIEFPVGAAIVALLLWAALARRERVAPPEPWHKHRQVVRALPDPAMERDLAVLERWLGSGDDPRAAADVVARAVSTDPVVQDRTRADLTEQMSIRASRRKRESLLKKHIEGV